MEPRMAETSIRKNLQYPIGNNNQTDQHNHQQITTIERMGWPNYETEPIKVRSWKNSNICETFVTWTHPTVYSFQKLNAWALDIEYLTTAPG